ncbi:hypothetical protein [Patulibacter sp.]|uniref:hypothetical protein n=1 Tax=Patulibacter sp. TaxID=1912859 RepID=UPI002715A1DF|nr:hypothetical protein [Patulibacter sp.]MDO9407719.1 hypothetical protein [Patulibacter sp.]
MSADTPQAVVHESARGRVVAVDSAYDTRAENRGRDVVVNASYCGVLPARFVAEHAPRGAIGVDCGIGPDGAGIAGLWFLEALGIPAATADIDTVVLGDGVEMHRSATVSRVNALAERCGVAAGMGVREAAELLLERDPVELAPSEATRRTVVDEAHGREVVCTDSIAFGLPEDRGRTVLVTAGHTGRSAVPYLRRVAPWGFICSDGGGGRDDSGTAGLREVEADGLAGATVDGRTARMGDGRSTYDDGVISAANLPARRRGVRVGQPAREAARLLASDDPKTEAP